MAMLNSYCNKLRGPVGNFAGDHSLYPQRCESCAAIFSLKQVWDHPPVSSSLKLKPANIISAHIYIERERAYVCIYIERERQLHHAIPIQIPIMSMVYKKYYHHLGIAPQHPQSIPPTNP